MIQPLGSVCSPRCQEPGAENHLHPSCWRRPSQSEQPSAREASEVAGTPRLVLNSEGWGERTEKKKNEANFQQSGQRQG